MSFPISVLTTTRKNILSLCESLNIDQLNHIPPGFNNNLIWNAGHVIATQQLLCYGLAGQPTHIDHDFIDRYRKGSRPTGPVPVEEWAFIKENFSATIEQFEKDLTALDFSNFRQYPTSFGVTLTNIGQALSFNNTHEAMHFGTMLAMRKLV